MIPIVPFVNPPVGSREYNAVKKAVKIRPQVVEAGIEPQEFMPYRAFLVGDKPYRVSLHADADDQHFVECDCFAGRPPVDSATGLPTIEPIPCYHAASVLLFIAEQEK